MHIGTNHRTVSEVNSNAKSALFSLLFVKRSMCVHAAAAKEGESIETHACVLNQRQQIRLQNDEDLPVLGDYFSVFLFFASPRILFFPFSFFLRDSKDLLHFPQSVFIFSPLFFRSAIMSALMPKFVSYTPLVL